MIIIFLFINLLKKRKLKGKCFCCKFSVFPPKALETFMFIDFLFERAYV